MRMPIPFFISLGMLVIMTFLSLGLWSAIPAGTMLPVYFDLQGNANSFATPAVALFILPAAMLFAIGVFVMSPMINPRAMNRPALYAVIWVLVVFALVIGHGMIIRQALFALAPAHA
jgi:uncharacterized membrane protein